MDYQTLLSETKIFLEKTHISKWCSLCKGYCCQGCHEGYPDDCHNRLACKLYLCDAMKGYIFEKEYWIGNRYLDMEMYVGKVIRKHGVKNQWFDPYTPSMDSLQFDDSILRLLFVKKNKRNKYIIERNKIKRKIDSLIKNNNIYPYLKNMKERRNQYLSRTNNLAIKSR